jgi:hypothetical protein
MSSPDKSGFQLQAARMLPFSWQPRGCRPCSREGKIHYRWAGLEMVRQLKLSIKFIGKPCICQTIVAGLDDRGKDGGTVGGFSIQNVQGNKIQPFHDSVNLDEIAKSRI